MINRLLAIGPLVWIGQISYSLYLVHWPIAVFRKYVTLTDASLIDIVVMLFASVGLAWLSWRFVERPFRRISRDRLNPIFIGQAAAICIGIGVGTALIATQGLPARFPDFHQRQISGLDDWGGDHCFNPNPTHATPWSDQACKRVNGQGGRILLWGDSFAAEYMPGILRDTARIDADVYQYTFAGCPPVLAYYSFARVACAPFNRRALDIIDQKHIDTVVLAARWIDTPRHTIDRLGETVRLLRSKGLRVIVVGQSPIFAMDIQHLDYLSGQSRRPGSVKWPVAIDRMLNRSLETQARGGEFVDPLLYLCDGAACVYRVGSEYYYLDDGHFSTAGSLRATRAYFPSERFALPPVHQVRSPPILVQPTR